MKAQLRRVFEFGNALEALVECPKRLDRTLVLKCDQECVVRGYS